MSPWAALAVFAAGLVAGTANVIVGAGSLVTFPVLLALGYGPVVANVSNNVGLIPGNVSGVLAYRRELVGQRSRAVVLGSASAAGAVAGALGLLVLPASVFRDAVPGLILFAAVLMALQPRLVRAVERRRGRTGDGGVALAVGVFLTGVYGGYFGAAQGVVLIALLAVLIDDGLQRLNAVKNVLAMVVNAVAGVVFVLLSHVAWPVAGLIAAGSIIGGQVGGRIGQRLPAETLRWVIVVVGTAVAVALAVAWF